MLEGPAVDAVVGCVETALGEPGNVASLEAAGANGPERAVPVQRLASFLLRNQYVPVPTKPTG